MVVAPMQPVIIISRSIVVVTPDELMETGSNLVVGMKHDAELNRQALLNAEELCATRASLAEQRALATAAAIVLRPLCGPWQVAKPNCAL